MNYEVQFQGGFCGKESEICFKNGSDEGKLNKMTMIIKNFRLIQNLASKRNEWDCNWTRYL